MPDTKHKAIDSFKSQMKDMQAAMDDEDKMQEEMESVLCIDEYVHKHVCLALGGPTQYFDITFQNGEAIRGEWYDSWAEPQVVTLTEEDLQTVVDFYCLDV